MNSNLRERILRESSDTRENISADIEARAPCKKCYTSRLRRFMNAKDLGTFKSWQYKMVTWMLIVMMAIVLVFTVALQSVVERIERESFDNTWQEKIRLVNLMFNKIDDTLDNKPNWGDYRYEDDLKNTTEDLDEWYGVFAALYNTKLELISRRIYYENETKVELTPDSPILAYIGKDISREFTVNIKTSGGKSDEFIMYYRWVPALGSEHESYLLLIGMNRSKHLVHPSDALIEWSVGLIGLCLFMVVVALVASKYLEKYEKERGWLTDEC